MDKTLDELDKTLDELDKTLDEHRQTLSQNLHTLTSQADAENFLKAQGLAIKEAVVCKVVDLLARRNRGERETSLRSLWNPGSASHICSKGTADKIRELLSTGRLEPYLQYIRQPESPGQNQLPAPASTTPSGVVNQKDEAELHSNEATQQDSPNAEPTGPHTGLAIQGPSEERDSAPQRYPFPDVEHPPWKRLPSTPTASHVEDTSSSQQTRSALTLKVVGHKVQKNGNGRYTRWSLSLVPDVEAYASKYIEVSKCVLILGGKQIKEELPYHPDSRELLTADLPDTWRPEFRIPEWVRPGDYRVCIGAMLRDREHEHRMKDTAYRFLYSDRVSTIVKSNEFAITVPDWPTPRVKAKVDAQKRFNTEAAQQGE